MGHSDGQSCGFNAQKCAYLAASETSVRDMSRARCGTDAMPTVAAPAPTRAQQASARAHTGVAEIERDCSSDAPASLSYR